MLPSAKAEELVVLAIDDDADVIHLLQENLGDAGYRVVGALSAAEGLEKAKALTHDKVAYLQDGVAPGDAKAGPGRRYVDAASAAGARAVVG